MHKLEPNWEYYCDSEGFQVRGFMKETSQIHFNHCNQGEYEGVCKYGEKDCPATGDSVNSPSHYGSGKIECIDYIEDFLTKEEFIGYLRGNIAKYMHRWRRKGKPVEDLEKARVYLGWLIDVVSKNEK